MPILAGLLSLGVIAIAVYVDTQVLHGWRTLLLTYLLSLGLLLHVLLERRTARGALAWIFLIVFLPLVGAVFYLLVGSDRVRKPKLKRRQKRLAQMKARPRSRRLEDSQHALQIEGENVPAANTFTAAERKIMRFATASTHRLPTSGNCSEVFFSGKDFRDKLLNSIKNAKKFIHFEYFIFRPDEEGRLVLEELTKAVQRGVEVRLLFDAAGCWKMHSKRTRDFKKAGGKVGWFFPLNPISSPMSMNLRNHRKISIFDGSSAFTGGLNLANEYLRETDDAGVRWLDGHMFLQGPCVEGLSEVFAEDWMTATTEDLSEREEFFFPKIEPAGDEVIQIVESGPDQTARPFAELIFSAVTLADKSVRLATPYFAPEESILQALRVAALRGVTIKLLLPGSRHSGTILHWCARWHYEELLEAGVRIYEWNEGFLHAKIISIDGAWGTVGSANMDERSFRLNFEVNALLFDNNRAQELDDKIDQLCEQSRRVTLEMHRNRSHRKKLFEALARLLAPQL